MKYVVQRCICCRFIWKVTTIVYYIFLQLYPFEQNVLRKLLAKKQISVLVNKINGHIDKSNEDIISEIIKISENNNVLSPFTAFIGIDDGREIGEINKLTNNFKFVDGMNIVINF